MQAVCPAQPARRWRIPYVAAVYRKCYAVFYRFRPGNNRAYKITLNSSEKKLLKINDSSNVRCLSIAVVPEDYKKTTVNMKCPIVINSDENLAAQVILPEKYEIRLPIYVDKGAK